MNFVKAAGVRRLAITAGAASLLLGMGTAVTVVSDAHAESGRRICVYQNDETGFSNEDGTILLSFVVDYKNGGGCPDTTYTKMDVDTKEAIEKITCEKFAQREKLKEDPCPKMIDDHIYAVYNYSQSYHPDKATDLSDKGKAW